MQGKDNLAMCDNENKTEENIEEITRNEDFSQKEKESPMFYQQEKNKDVDNTEINLKNNDGNTIEPKIYSFDDFVDETDLKELEKLQTEEQQNENFTKSKEMKEEGNTLYKDGLFHESIELYTDALKMCPLRYSEDRSILYSNRAACKISLNSKKPAIDDCTKAIELNPNYLRALLRRSKLYEETEQFEESLEDYKQVLKLDSNNIEAREAVLRLPLIINERNEKLKNDLLGKLKDLGNMVLRPFGLSTNNFQMQQDPNTGSYSINFNK
ncbi:TTC1 family protein [Megaselia abdita]